ncbi:hypothetical protein [Chryseobacterium joostei]|nr:hypothetical protein [Chryseobacterium joostei]
MGIPIITHYTIYSLPITSPDRNGYPTAGRQIGTGNGKAVERGV